MLHDDSDDGIDRFTRGIIRRKVKQLVGRAGFMRQDFGDLENDFYVAASCRPYGRLTPVRHIETPSSQP